MHYRSTKKENSYSRYKKTQKQSGSNECVFCATKPDSEHHLSQKTHFKLIQNRFAYDFWDDCKVVDHFMIVPIIHTETLSTLPAEAQLEFVQLISEYEAQGYDIFARAPVSTSKTVPHQHTHLIKTDGKPVRAALYLHKPYTAIHWW